MGKRKKFFAVRIGRKVGVFDNWHDTQESTSGYANADFKGFETESEARNYLENDSTLPLNNQDVDLQYVDLLAYVDGSKLGEKNGYGIGALILNQKREIIDKHSELGKNPKLLDFRQISGELEAVLYVLNFAIKKKVKKVKIFYDYEGIQMWAEKKWKRRSPVSLYYEREFDRLISKGQLEIIFEKIKAHSGNEYNEIADQLAKQAFSEKDHTVNVDGSHSLRGIYNRSDLIALMDIINSDESDLIVESEDNSSDRMVLQFKTTNSHAKGTYTESTGLLFLQGSSTSDALLQAVSYAVSLLPSKEDVLTIMASFTDFPLNASLVDSSQKKLLPNYHPQQEEKIFENMIYQTIVNYNDDSEAFDYTYRITPLFRLCEHLLIESFQNIGKRYDLYHSGTHLNFGNVMIKNTDDEVFSGARMHRVKDDYADQFGLEKTELVNKLYSFYNKTRHPFSHADGDLNDIPVVESNQEVKEWIQKGLALFDNYYRLFI